MTQKPPKTERTPPQEIHFESVRLTADCILAFGQSQSMSMGLIVCSSNKKPSKYSASMIHPAAATIRVKWLSSEGKIRVCRIPWARVIGAYEFGEGDEPAPLA
jgi:hypothetical protein